MVRTDEGLRWLVGLRWSDVDLVAGLASLDDTKNGEPRLVPLGTPALNVFKARVIQCNGVADLVFPGKNNVRPIDIRTPWESALRRSGIKDFRFHDLRHTAASYMAMSGATPIDLAAVLGHKTLQMVHRYSHLSTPHLAGIVNQMNERVFGND